MFESGGFFSESSDKTDITQEYCSTWVNAYQARAAGDKEQTLKLVQKATAGFAATADLPPSDFIPELMELYPDAKVILMRRDSQKWWNSIAAVGTHTTPWWIGIALAPIPGWRCIPALAKEYARFTLGLVGLSYENSDPVEFLQRGGPHLLEAHSDRIRSLVPKDMLLQMELSEGWEPLCWFLGVPVPNEPFPRANDAKAAGEYAARVMFKVLQVWVSIFAATGISIYSGFLLWKYNMS